MVESEGQPFSFPGDPRRLRAVIDHLPAPVTVITPDGRIVLANRKAGDAMGMEPDELPGHAFSATFPWADPAHRARFQEALSHARTGDPVQVQVTSPPGEGQSETPGIHLIPLAQDVGRAQHILVWAPGPPPQAQVLAELKEGEARFQALLDLIPQLVWSTTPDGYHDYFNQRWYDYTGMSRTGHQGWNWKDYLHPDDYEHTMEVWQHSLATGEPYEVEYRFRRASDGAYRWFIGRALPLMDEKGEVVRWFGTCTDVHEERMAREAARQSEHRYQAVTDATNDVIWDWDLDTDELWWNENLERVLGLAPEDLATLDQWCERIYPSDRARVEEGLEQTLADPVNDIWTDDYRFRLGDGSLAEIHDRGMVVRDSQGRARNVVGSMMDVTERNRLEAELRQAQKLEAVGKVAGGMAHDFNNLLTVITNSVELVRSHLPKGSGALEDLAEIEHAARRASSLTRQLLAFSRRQVLKPTLLKLNVVVDQLQGMLERVIGETIRISFQPDPRLHPVRADRSQLEQVIMNLALNARDAMPHGGTLTLSTSNVTIQGATGGGQRQETSGHVDPGEYVQLLVQDTGIGMDDSILERIFEPFFTTKPLEMGTGLGLPTVLGIVSQSGGFIDVESEPGKGSEFRVHLPAAQALASDEVERQVPTSPPSGQPTAGAAILIVEDQEDVRRATRRILVRNGHTVLEAPNGSAALEILFRDSTGVDLVLSDLVMPGMGGRELLERVRDEGIQVPFIFMSGYTEDEVFRESALSEGSRFLEKPYSPRELNQMVRAALGGA